MKTVPLEQLSEDVRQLLADAEQSGGLLVEDENGQARGRIYAYAEPSISQRQAAWDRLRDFQKRVQQSFDVQGVSEDDLDRLIRDAP